MSMHGWGDPIQDGSQGRILAKAGLTRAGLAKAGATALLIVGLAGCSAVPDWAKPSAIYGEEQAAESPSDATGFPQLAEVPGEKPTATSQDRQKEIANGLVADREAAKHTDEVLRGGTEPPAPAPQVTAPTPVKPLEDVPAEVEDKRSSSERPKLLPMPGRGGHATLSAAKRIQTAAADTPKAPEPEVAEAKPAAAADAEQPVTASPTTPVEVKPASADEQAKL